MLLLFAALFSAILTVFLIESKDLLQQDPADASAALLLMVVQSQQRIELGLPSPVDTPTTDLPAFVPPASARWINEWLTAYLASRPRPPRSHALLRQARLEGLERWWALHIIALLPSLLHISLFLFAIGLVVYLWTLDTVVVGVIAGIIGITTLFYLVTACLGAVSGYVKRAFDYYSRPQPSEDDRSNVTSVKDLQALLWLANNSRDPAVVDCSYHALAGLHHQADLVSLSGAGDTRVDPDPTLQKYSRLPMQINSDTTMLSLFYTLAERFKKVATNPHMFSVGDTNLERYATALMWMFNYIKTSTLTTQPNSSQMARRSKAPSAEYVLSLLEDIWSNNSASFSANTYAGLLATQMTLLNLAVSLQSRSNNTPSRPPVKTQPPNSHGLDTVTGSAHVVDIVVANPNSPNLQQLSDLRASYSRTLCRTSYLLRLYSEQKVQIDVSAFISLLDALRTAVGCEELNPEDSTSTHHAQRNSAGSLYFSMGVSRANANIWYFSADDLYGGPLGSLIEILGMKPDIPEAMLFRTRTAAIEAFSTLAPVLLQQVLRLDRAELQREFDFKNWSDLPPLDMPGIRYVASRQMFLVLRYLGPRLDQSDAYPKLVPNALDLIHDYIKDAGDNKTFGTRLAVQRHSEDLVPLIEFASVSDSNLEMLWSPSPFLLIALARTQWLTMCETVLSPICFPALIQMVASAVVDTPIVEDLLQSMSKHIRNGPINPGTPNVASNNTPSIDYLNCFTHTEKGFSAFSIAATANAHRGVIVDAIVEFVRLAANRHHVLEGASVELRTPAVPGFLDVVSVVAKYCMRNSERQRMLLDYSRDVIKLLEVATEHQEAQELITKHEACNDLYSALGDIGEHADALEILDQMKGLRRKLGIENTVEPKVKYSSINALANVNASDNENSGYPVDDLSTDVDMALPEDSRVEYMHAFHLVIIETMVLAWYKSCEELEATTTADLASTQNVCSKHQWQQHLVYFIWALICVNMSRALSIEGLTNVVPLPGVGEMRDIVKGLMNIAKATGYKTDQCESLARRFGGLIAVADTSRGHEDFTEILRQASRFIPKSTIVLAAYTALSQLQEMKTRFEKKLAHKSKFSRIYYVQARLQAYENLSRELSEVMESTQSLLAEDGTKKDLMQTEDGLTTIPTGQMAETQLERLSRVKYGLLSPCPIHKNVAAIVGVMKGRDGIDGFMVAMVSRYPQKVFPSNYSSQDQFPVVLWAVICEVFKKHLSFSQAPVHGLGCRFEGHLLTEYSQWSPDFEKWDMNTTIQKALRIHEKELRRLKYCARDKGTSRLTEALMSLGQSDLTELRLLKVLADYMIEPFGLTHCWPGFRLLPFTVRTGYLGIIEDRVSWDGEWQVLEASDGADETVSLCRRLVCGNHLTYTPTNSRREDADAHLLNYSNNCKGIWERLPHKHPQFRTWVTDYHYERKPTSFFHRSSPASTRRWEDVMKRAKALSIQHKLELYKISHVCRVFVIAFADMSDSSKPLAPEARLYFHRNSFARSRPRELYGFFSAEPNPCALRTGLEDLNWSFCYFTSCDTMLIGDNWERQYQRAVQVGLAVMPGVYPGACIDEVSDREME
ncbi:hypothetical protein BDV93DRAFT_509542 [Ceratobasidium sp. AG-I]|nr:hypothetical protein BDV93DRAFT_509542 [Ceratobasidium sp. AG-I]